MTKIMETNKQLKTLVVDSLTKSPKDIVEAINKFEDRKDESKSKGINALVSAGVIAILAGVAFGVNLEPFFPKLQQTIIACLITAAAFVKGLTGCLYLIEAAQIDAYVQVVKDYIEKNYPEFFKDIKSNNGKIKTLKQTNE